MTPGRRRDEPIAADAELVLSDGQRTQVLYRPREWGEPTYPRWQLLWAGDLDGDRRLDLLIDLTWHYNLSQRMLFLSSVAAPGRLLRKVGLFETIGC